MCVGVPEWGTAEGPCAAARRFTLANQRSQLPGQETARPAAQSAAPPPQPPPPNTFCTPGPRAASGWAPGPGATVAVVSAVLEPAPRQCRCDDSPVVFVSLSFHSVAPSTRYAVGINKDCHPPPAPTHTQEGKGCPPRAGWNRASDTVTCLWRRPEAGRGVGEMPSGGSHSPPIGLLVGGISGGWLGEQGWPSQVGAKLGHSQELESQS